MDYKWSSCIYLRAQLSERALWWHTEIIYQSTFGVIVFLFLLCLAWLCYSPLKTYQDNQFCYKMKEKQKSPALFGWLLGLTCGKNLWKSNASFHLMAKLWTKRGVGKNGARNGQKLITQLNKTFHCVSWKWEII